VIDFQKQFTLHFKDVDVSKFQWVRNPCAANYVSRLMICEQEQLTDISCDGSPKDMFDADKLVQFLLLVTNDYPSLSREVVKVLLHFVTTDLCETGFSAVAIMNTIYLSQLITEMELGVAILSMAPRFGKLYVEKQVHPSHEMRHWQSAAHEPLQDIALLVSNIKLSCMLNMLLFLQTQ
jgi:hypothetical protein